VAKGIHLRYLGDDVRAVEGVGLFQKGTVAWVQQELAIRLVDEGAFETVSDGPSAQFFIVRIGPDRPMPEPVRSVEPTEPAEFERELEEEERRYQAEATEEADKT
jgi:hypothetical protein